MSACAEALSPAHNECRPRRVFPTATRPCNRPVPRQREIKAVVHSGARRRSLLGERSSARFGGRRRSSPPLGSASTTRADYCFDPGASTKAASTPCARVAMCETRAALRLETCVRCRAGTHGDRDAWLHVSGRGSQLPCCGRRANDCFAQGAATPPVLTPLLILGERGQRAIRRSAPFVATLGSASTPRADYCFDPGASTKAAAPPARLWRISGTLSHGVESPALHSTRYFLQSRTGAASGRDAPVPGDHPSEVGT